MPSIKRGTSTSIDESQTLSADSGTVSAAYLV
jgi:hypothetical protein